MNYKEQMKIEFTHNEKMSNAILIGLLLVRLVDADLAIWAFGTSMPDWVPYLYNGVAYILTAVIVWLNRHRLATINIDRSFVVALIVGGVLYSFQETPYNIGALVGITAGLFYWGFINNQFVYKNPAPYPKGTVLLILLSILLALAPVGIFQPTFKTALSFQSFSVTLMGALQIGLMLNAFEEVIFRGALWAYLRSLGLSEQIAFSVQAVLFWIAHHRDRLDGGEYFFWIAVPCMAILLGILAWRSKSLTPSLAAHFLFNFTSQLLFVLL